MHRSCMGSVRKRLSSNNAQLGTEFVSDHREGNSFLVYRQQAQDNPLLDSFDLLVGHADIQGLVDNIVEGDLLNLFRLQWYIISLALFL